MHGLSPQEFGVPPEEPCTSESSLDRVDVVSPLLALPHELLLEIGSHIQEVEIMRSSAFHSRVANSGVLLGSIFPARLPSTCTTYTFLFTLGHHDVIQAVLGILLVILPNLKELYLAENWLMYFPIFEDALSEDIYYMSPSRWDHPFLVDILHRLYPKLEVLEFPTDLAGLRFPYRRSVLITFQPFLDSDI
ncbi:hypothetical protein K469DRAFT_751193 [Zopfia rhizophila CBS 207.26]|uniref:Uncharacterized protein n=1 Tax=Zopfia rhizophila CBS 207.26 TaxID=1314779 RepID=A0A6A6DZG5_9PEZI|nr:hypothetical protein K469DRAFT_751193 [Zopfia rhizophila CBS 207.26]